AHANLDAGALTNQPPGVTVCSPEGGPSGHQDVAGGAHGANATPSRQCEGDSISGEGRMAQPWRMTKQSVAITVVATLAVLLSCYGGTAQAEDCVAPSPETAPVKVVNIYNNATVPIYAVLETAKQDLRDADGRPHDRWLQAEFNPTPGTYASTYLYRVYIN